MMKNKLGIYIHIPFCEKKCNYCDFNSRPTDSNTIKRYVDSLVKEINKESISYNRFVVDSIFIGGGTPSLLDSEAIEKIVTELKNNFYISDDVEFTIELNPNSTSLEKLLLYKKLGINRLSFGAQSFNDLELETLGRVHKKDDIIKAVKLAQNRGFENINLDLMIGIPYQGLDSLKNSLDLAISLGVKHISCYSLIIEENTKFYCMLKDEKSLNLPEENLEREMYYFACDYLQKNKYIQYEISNFATKDYESKHNLKYWYCNDYVGFGLASHSRLGNVRFSNIEILEKYIDFIENNKSVKKEFDYMSRLDMLNEYIFMGFRLLKGINYKNLNNEFEIDFLSDYFEEIDKNLKKEYIEVEGDYIHLTKRGLNFSNLVELDFYRR